MFKTIDIPINRLSVGDWFFVRGHVVEKIEKFTDYYLVTFAPFRHYINWPKRDEFIDHPREAVEYSIDYICPLWAGEVKDLTEILPFHTPYERYKYAVRNGWGPWLLPVVVEGRAEGTK